METSLMYHHFDFVLCTESTDSTKFFTANYFTLNYQKFNFYDRGNRRIERNSLFKIERPRNLCIKSILFQA